MAMDNYIDYFYTQVAITCLFVPFLLFLNLFQWYCERFQSSPIPDIPKTIHRLAPFIGVSFSWSFLNASQSDLLHYIRDCLAATATALLIYGLICIVYFTLAAVYRSNKFEEPKLLKQIFSVFPFATLVLGVVTATLVYLTDRLWWAALSFAWYAFLILLSIALIWYYTFRIFKLLEMAKTNSHSASRSNITESSVSSVPEPKERSRPALHVKTYTQHSLGSRPASPRGSPTHAVRTLDSTPATATPAAVAATPLSPPLSAPVLALPSSPSTVGLEASPPASIRLQKKPTMHTSQREFRRVVLRNFRYKLALITTPALAAVGGQAAGIAILLLDLNREYAGEPAFAGLCYFLVQLAGAAIGTVLAWQPVTEEMWWKALYAWTCRRAKIRQMERMEQMEREQREREDHQKSMEEGKAGRDRKQKQHYHSSVQMTEREKEKTHGQALSNTEIVLTAPTTAAVAEVQNEKVKAATVTVGGLGTMIEVEEKEIVNSSYELQDNPLTSTVSMSANDVEIAVASPVPSVAITSTNTQNPTSSIKPTHMNNLSSSTSSSSGSGAYGSDSASNSRIGFNENRSHHPSSSSSWFAALQTKFSAPPPPPPPPSRSPHKKTTLQLQTPPQIPVQVPAPVQTVEADNQLRRKGGVLVR